QKDVLASGEIEVKAGAELEQRADPPTGDDPAGGRLEDAGDQLEERRLAGAVPADQAERLPRRDLERHIAQSPDVARGRPAARDDRVLQRPVRPLGDPEALRDAIDDDPAGGGHPCSRVTPRPAPGAG